MISGNLRAWQTDCIETAIQRYDHDSHFFCQATPGAGKTIMAATLAARLFDQGKIDLVLCFAPSCQVVESIERTFTQVLGRRMDGLIGAVGAVCTYQGMEYRGEGFWQMLTDFRVLAVFDEIHHCAGYNPILSNAWGQQILQRVQDKAAYTIALSGTPWRSDREAIVLARYSDPEGRVICDYRYGLRKAIQDNVCRSPRIVLLDNTSLKLTEEHEDETTIRVFSSIESLLEQSSISYENLLMNENALAKLLTLASEQLSEIREIKSNAGGLIVASSIAHAQQISITLKLLGETCVVVTNRTLNAHRLIDKFRTSCERWIVAVGMISEGTDIPRLQVCCHLSRIRTELHFRQVLGRILRRTGDNDEHAWLFTLAEPALIDFSQRVSEDLPEDLAVVSFTETDSSLIITATDLDTYIDGQTECCIESLERESPVREFRWPEGNSSSSCEISFSNNYRAEVLAVY